MKSKLMLCFLLCSYAVFGQEEEYEQEADSTVTNFLSEITVSSTKWEQNIREIPAKVSSITKPAIEFQNPQTAADLLGLNGNVFIQKSQQGGGSPMIRGFATNRVMLVIDGVRMNNAIFRSGNVQNVISLDANAIEETEVVFGPGSVVYGSDAIGGVMDFHTLRPNFSSDGSMVSRANVFARYSSANNEKTIHGDVGLGWKKWAFITSVTNADYDDLKSGSNGPEEYQRPDYVIREGNADAVKMNADPDLQVGSGYSQFNAMQKISFAPAATTKFAYAFHYSKTSDNPRYDRLILKEGGEFADAEWYYGPQKWMMHSLSVNVERSRALFDRVLAIVAYQDYEESRHTRGFNASRRTDRWENVKAFSANVDLDKKLSKVVTIFYGAELVANNVGSTAQRFDVTSGDITPASTRYPDDSNWRSIAMYASGKFTLTQKLLMTASARFTNIYTEATFDTTFFDFPFTYSQTVNNALNGGLGFVYNPTEKLKVFTNLSTAFRAPNIDDIGKVFESVPGQVTVPNPELEPEFAYNFEVGFAALIGRKAKLDVAGFYTILDNAIARGPATFQGQDSIEYDGTTSKVVSLQNISSLWVTGIQLGLEFPVGDLLKVRSTYNYQIGEEKTPGTDEVHPPTHVAPANGATHVIFSGSKFMCDLYTVYNGAIAYKDLALSEQGDHHLYAKDATGQPYSPSWMTLNFKATYQFYKFLTADAGVENILDKRYRPYSSGIAAPGRNFIITLRARFN